MPTREMLTTSLLALAVLIVLALVATGVMWHAH
jgi:hypothetical protein